MSDEKQMQVGAVGDGQEFPTMNPARGRVFVHADDPLPDAPVSAKFRSREAAIEAAKREVGASRSIDLSDDGPMPRVTRAEALLYSADLAPVVREIGASFTSLRRGMVQLSTLVNEARQQRHQTGEDATALGDDPIVRRWQDAFTALAPAYELLMDAYPEVVRIGIDAGRAEQYAADVERSELAR